MKFVDVVAKITFSHGVVSFFVTFAGEKGETGRNGEKRERRRRRRRWELGEKRGGGDGGSAERIEGVCEGLRY